MLGFDKKGRWKGSPVQGAGIHGAKNEQPKVSIPLQFDLVLNNIFFTASDVVFENLDLGVLWALVKFHIIRIEPVNGLPWIG